MLYICYPKCTTCKKAQKWLDDNNISWIKSLTCLKKCNMSIEEMKEYLALCLKGESTIPERQAILAVKKEQLLKEMSDLQESIDFLNWKENFYNDVISGKTEYFSYLIDTNQK